jgi:hypothetical protein
MSFIVNNTKIAQKGIKNEENLNGFVIVCI